VKAKDLTPDVAATKSKAAPPVKAQVQAQVATGSKKKDAEPAAAAKRKAKVGDSKLVEIKKNDDDDSSSSSGSSYYSSSEE